MYTRSDHCRLISLFISIPMIISGWNENFFNINMLRTILVSPLWHETLDMYCGHKVSMQMVSYKDLLRKYLITTNKRKYESMPKLHHLFYLFKNLYIIRLVTFLILTYLGPWGCKNCCPRSTRTRIPTLLVFEETLWNDYTVYIQK